MLVPFFPKVENSEYSHWDCLLLKQGWERQRHALPGRGAAAPSAAAIGLALDPAAETPEPGEREGLQAPGAAVNSTVTTTLGIIRATAHWQEVGYSRVLHNLRFTDDG